MVGLDADKLVELQAEWKKIISSTPEQCTKNLEKFESIVIGLKHMGLQTAYDSTYELLSPGLDREAFRHKRTEMHLLQALNTYHGARRISDDGFLGQANRRQYNNLRQLLIFDLPSYESHVASTGLSETLNPLLVQEIKDLCALKTSGVLDAELARLNIECAKDAFRNAYTMNADQEKDLAKGGGLNYRPVKMAFAYAQSALKSINEVGGAVTPCMIPVDYDNAGYWTKERTHFDRAAVVGLHDTLLLRACRMELREALIHQEEGRFSLHAAGTARGVQTLPIQSIIETLTAHKYNMKVPATFAAMGTTPDQFWAAYQRERQAIAADPVHAGQLAPEFKPGR
jgi:hypothetical protein